MSAERQGTDLWGWITLSFTWCGSELTAFLPVFSQETRLYLSQAAQRLLSQNLECDTAIGLFWVSPRTGLHYRTFSSIKPNGSLRDVTSWVISQHPTAEGGSQELMYNFSEEKIKKYRLEIRPSNLKALRDPSSLLEEAVWIVKNQSQFRVFYMCIYPFILCASNFTDIFILGSTVLLWNIKCICLTWRKLVACYSSALYLKASLNLLEVLFISPFIHMWIVNLNNSFWAASAKVLLQFKLCPVNYLLILHIMKLWVDGNSLDPRENNKSALPEKFSNVDTLLAQENLHFADNILTYDSSWFGAKVLGENALIKMLTECLLWSNDNIIKFQNHWGS